MNVLLWVLFLSLEIANSLSQAYDENQLEKYPELGKDFFLFPMGNGELKIGYLNYPGGIQPRLFGIGEHNFEEDITFTLFTRNHLEGWLVDDFEQLSQYFDKAKKTKFVTHGWLANGTSEACARIKDTYLNTSDVNVFVMDWSPIADNAFYPIPMKATSDVGKHYAKFLNRLINEMDADPKDIHLIGHSLGAHISGFAARGVEKGKIGRVTGLDPALPGFNVPLVEGGRLSQNDSEFVDIIHTCAGVLGIKEPIGHADFYPNGGTPPQPGCNILGVLEACSHARSFKLFSDSIALDEPFMASKCDAKLLSSFGREQCGGSRVPMGEPTPWDTFGVFFLKTSDEEPFVINDVGFDDGNQI